MSGTSRGGGSKEQEEIARLKKEKEQMAEKLRILELEKEGIKVRTLSMFDGQKIGKSIRSRGSIPGFQPVVEVNMIEENPRMAMYEAQAIAKDMEMVKMKEEMERLKREKDEMFELMKQLGNDRRVTATSELISRNMELDILKDRDKEKKAEIDETKRKNEELEERLRRLELNREVLSADCIKWIKIDFIFPDRSWFGGAVYLDNELYLIGGYRNPKALYKLDKTSKWMQMDDMNIGRQYIRNSCLEWNGYIWVIAGRNDKGKKLASVERYDPKENKWTLMPDMKHPRSSAAAATWNNGIVISGNSGGAGRTVEFLSPENGSWTELPRMPKVFSRHSLVSYKNKLIVMGDYDGKMLNSVWQLNPEDTNPTWRPLPSMKHRSRCFGGIVFNEEIYVIGGEREGFDSLDRVEIFNGKHWRDGPSLPTPMKHTSAMVIPQHFADRLCNYKP